MKKAYRGFPITRVTRNFARPQYTAEMARKLLTRVRERLISSPSAESGTLAPSEMLKSGGLLQRH